jgi:hypothetical protein
MGLNMKKNIDSALTTSTEYRRFIEDLKARVISARICAARAVNRDLILLYGTSDTELWRNKRHWAGVMPWSRWWPRTCDGRFRPARVFRLTIFGA